MVSSATALRIPVCVLLLGLGAMPAAAADNGLALLGFFENTCARRPALPTALQALAKEVGFESTHGDIKPDMETRASIDIIYSAQLVQGAATFKLSAYFVAEIPGVTSVSCSLATTGVNAPDLAQALGAAEKVTAPSSESSPDGLTGWLKWTYGPAHGNDRLEMSFRRDELRRTSLSLIYQIRKP